MFLPIFAICLGLWKWTGLLLSGYWAYSWFNKIAGFIFYPGYVSGQGWGGLLQHPIKTGLQSFAKSFLKHRTFFLIYNVFRATSPPYPLQVLTLKFCMSRDVRHPQLRTMANPLYPHVVLHFYKPLMKEKILKKVLHTENISFIAKCVQLIYEVFGGRKKHTHKTGT